MRVARFCALSLCLSSLVLLAVPRPSRGQTAGYDLRFDPAAHTWVTAAPDPSPSSASPPSRARDAGDDPLGGVEIISSFPFPAGWLYGRDIAWDGSSLWIGENFTSSIYEIDPLTGDVLSSFFGPSSNPWGLTFDGVNLINATTTLAGPPPDVLPDDVFTLTTGGGILDTWLAPDSPDANPHGCAFDPATGSLWLSDSESDTIYELDPADGAVRSSFAAPSGEVRGLAFDGQDLWAIDYEGLALVQLDLSGNVLFTVSIADLGGDPEGLAFDGRYLWITENDNDLIYQVDPGKQCLLAVELERHELRAGDRLAFHIELRHRRLRTVTVPFAIWVEDERGEIVAERTTRPHTLRFGDRVRFDSELELPARTAPGNYVLKVGARRMQQGVAWETRPFRIVP